MSCTVAMSVLTTSPISLSVGSIVEVTVEAYNLMGYSTPSTANTAGASVYTAPTAAVTSLARGSSTSTSQIQLTWTGITSSPSNGGVSVDYMIYWNQGSVINTWTTLTSSTSSATTFTETSGITSGLTYQFYVVAYNAYGDGPSSSTVTVYAGTAPSG